MLRSRRAWVYLLTIAALLIPAAGIAYLGAVSYRDERGAIAAQDDRQREAAAGIATRVLRAIERALAQVDRAAIEADDRPVVTEALGAYWFWLDASGRLQVPSPPIPPGDITAGLDRGAPCPQGTQLEDCVRELSTRQARVKRLLAAQGAEACTGVGCTTSLGDARRQYVSLSGFADTGPSAQLGLARVLRRLGDGRAASALADLETKFGDRTVEGVPVRLVVQMLRADSAAAHLAVGASVLRERRTLEPVIRLGVLARILALLPPTLRADLVVERARLEHGLEAIRVEARVAAGLADDVGEIARTATPEWRGRAAMRQPARTLIYRRRADGSVIGLSVDAPMLEAAAGRDPQDDVAQGARTLVLATGDSPAPDLRRIVQIPLGRPIPHLALAIVNPLTAPDPRDEVIRDRSNRHMMYTALLAVALAIGLLLIIRGAARARELAQLKSDFVSTVSHELKTPLTSIRMFAEMLEQGVAQGDASKMARYHGVIVQESQRLGLLIANLLDYAQIEKGTRRYTPSRHGLADLARHAVATFETLREPGGVRNPVELVVSPSAMRAEVDVDRDVVVQALLNLLANAAKYGGAESPIHVTAEADAMAGWIAVRDHGPGIPPAEQARIFREFYRAPEAYRSGVEGTGLGLALVKRHVEALGGTVEVASEVGQGATFTIRLPRVPEGAA